MTTSTVSLIITAIDWFWYIVARHCDFSTFCHFFCDTFREKETDFGVLGLIIWVSFEIESHCTIGNSHFQSHIKIFSFFCHSIVISWDAYQQWMSTLFGMRQLNIVLYRWAFKKCLCVLGVWVHVCVCACLSRSVLLCAAFGRQPAASYGMWHFPLRCLFQKQHPNPACLPSHRIKELKSERTSPKPDNAIYIQSPGPRRNLSEGSDAWQTTLPITLFMVTSRGKKEATAAHAWGISQPGCTSRVNFSMWTAAMFTEYIIMTSIITQNP